MVRHLRMVAMGALLAGFTLTAAPQADAQTAADVSSRVERLERELNALSEALYSDGQIPPELMDALRSPAPAANPVNDTSAARLVTRMGDLQAQMRALTGKVEETVFKIDQLSGRFDKLVADVDRRLTLLEQSTSQAGGGQIAQGTPGVPSDPNADTVRAVEQPVADDTEPGTLGQLVARSPEELDALVNQQAEPASASAPTSTPVIDATTAADGVLPAGTAEDRYKFAFNLLRRQDFAGAEQALRQFVISHPDHQYAGNAQYWLGETYYARGLYEDAIAVFKEGVQVYPDSNKTADNLLKMGMALANTGKAKEACITLGYLLANYPEASATVKRRANLEQQRRNCGG